MRSVKTVIFAANTPAEPTANMPASHDIIKELRDEMETLRGRLESIEKDLSGKCLLKKLIHDKRAMSYAC